MRVDEQKLHGARRLRAHDAVLRRLRRMIPPAREVLALHSQELRDSVPTVVELDVLLIQDAQLGGVDCGEQP